MRRGQRRSQYLSYFKLIRKPHEIFRKRKFPKLNSKYSAQFNLVKFINPLLTSYLSVTVKSNLLTIPQIQTIKKWLIETKMFGSYKACWETSMRDSRTQFYHECGINSYRFDPKITTWWSSITVFKLFENNRVFGGFTDLPWGSNRGRNRVFLVTKNADLMMVKNNK